MTERIGIFSVCGDTFLAIYCQSISESMLEDDALIQPLRLVILRIMMVITMLSLR
jgi:hypothetical protein